MSSDDYGASESMMLRHQTYADGFRRMTILAAAAVVAGGLGLGFGVWALTRQPEPKYFATQKDGQILPLIPLDQPYLSDSQVSNFAVDCVSKTLTVSFAVWQKNLSDSQSCFTREGWDAMMKALEDSSTLEFIKTRRLDSVATVAGASIVERGRADARYAWRVKMPINLTFVSSSEKTNQQIEALVEIVRTPTYENVSGVAINRFIAQPK